MQLAVPYSSTLHLYAWYSNSFSLSQCLSKPSCLTAEYRWRTLGVWRNSQFQQFSPAAEIFSVVQQCATFKHASDGNEGRMKTCLHILPATSAFSLFNTKPFNCSCCFTSECIILLHYKGCSLKYQYFMTSKFNLLLHYNDIYICDNCQAPISLPVLTASYLLATTSRTLTFFQDPWGFSHLIS